MANRQNSFRIWRVVVGGRGRKTELALFFTGAKERRIAEQAVTDKAFGI